MDVQNSSLGHETEGDQQSSELPNLSGKDKLQKASDHVTPSQKAETRHTLATEPFQPILKVLADHERDDPKYAFPAARLVGFYQRLWESCVSKHMGGEKLEQENLVLKEAGQRVFMSTVSGRTHGCQMHIQQDTSFANFHEEQQQYRNAVVGLFEKIRHSNEAELQELLETIRKPRLLSEAVQEALATSGHRNGDFIAETI
ncbi:Polynucleotidyl transferase [Penicillium brevicompactum]